MRTPPTERLPAAWGGPAATGLFAAGVVTALRTASSPYPRPGSTVAQVQDYFQGSAGPARISLAGQLASAAALIPYAEAVARLAASLPRRPGLARVARLAGFGAAATLAASALTGAVLTGPTGRDPDAARRLHRWAFIAGGPLHAATLGLLMAVLASAGWRTGRLPRTVSVAAAVSGAAGLAAPLYLLDERLVLLVPAGRFSALLLATISGVELAVA